MMSLSEVQVKFLLPFQSVLNIRMEVKANRHATAHIKGILIPDQDLNSSKSALEAGLSPVEISVQERILFSGLALETKIYKENGSCFVELNCISTTILLDRERCNYSFQDSEFTYEKLIQLRTESYGNCVYACHEKGLEQKIDGLVVEYDETDWGFFKRMASLKNAVLYPYPFRSGIHFEISFESGSSRMHQFDWKFCEIITDADGLHFVAQSDKLYHIGESAAIAGRSLCITEVELKTENENLAFYYRLGDIPQTERIYNDRITGALLLGEVIERKGNQLRLHLEIDHEPPKHTTFFYTYRPLTVSGLYAVPELGTTVSLYITDHNESICFATETVNDKAHPCNVDNKEFKTIDDEYLLMHPDVITFTNGDGTFNTEVTLDSISLSTDNRFRIRSQKSVNLYAGRYVTISAEDEVQICKGTGEKGSIRINDDVHFYAEKLKFEAVPCAVTEIPPQPPQPQGVDAKQVATAKAAAASVPSIGDARKIASLGVSPQALYAGRAAAASTPTTVSAKKFSVTNNPKVVLGAQTEVVHVLTCAEGYYYLYDSYDTQRTGYNSDSIDTLNKVVGNAQELEKLPVCYKINEEYKYTDFNGFIEQYLPMAFPGLPTTREITLETENGNTINVSESEVQVNFDAKIAMHESQMQSATKLAYMLFHTTSEDGKDFTGSYVEGTLKGYYQSEFNSSQAVYMEWKSLQQQLFTTEDSVKRAKLKEKIQALTGPADESIKSAFENYNSIRSASCYGMWAKWYSDLDGWHRGIDMDLGPGSKLFAICDGFIIYKYTYYFNVYVPEKDVTITYMHLNQGSVTASKKQGQYDEKATIQPFMDQYHTLRTELDLISKGAPLPMTQIDGILDRKEQMLKEAKLACGSDPDYKKTSDKLLYYVTKKVEGISGVKPIKKGQLIGTEGKNATDACHTHVEINPGFFYGTPINRPWAQIAGYKEPAISAIVPNLTGPSIRSIRAGNTAEKGFSMYPYDLIDQWFNAYD